MVRVLTPILLLLASASPAWACPVAVTVTGAPALEAALAAQQVGAPTPGCPSWAATATPVETGLRVELRSPDGLTDTRTVPDAEAAAIWIGSWLRGDRLDDLLTLPEGAVPPELLASLASDPEPPPPETPKAPTGIRLFASFEEWRADQSFASLPDVGLVQFAPEARLQGPGELGLLHALDLTRREAREVGAAWAFARDGVVYLNPWTVLPLRNNAFGPLEQIGAHGIFQTRQCRWIPATVASAGHESDGQWIPATVASPGHMQCDIDVRLLDLESGEVTRLNRKRLKGWLDEVPDLRAAFDAEPRKHLGVQRKYLAQLLTERVDQ